MNLSRPKEAQSHSFQKGGVAVHDGFPNAATDSSLQSLDLNKLLVKNSVSTYFMRVQGDHWQAYGVFSGSMVIIDRACPAQNNDLVIWHQHDGMHMSPKHRVPERGAIWGTVTSTVRQFKP